MKNAVKYARKNKKMLSVYLETDQYRLIAARAGFRNITISQWVRMAVYQLIEKENQYL